MHWVAYEQGGNLHQHKQVTIGRKRDRVLIDLIVTFVILTPFISTASKSCEIRRK